MSNPIAHATRTHRHRARDHHDHPSAGGGERFAGRLVRRGEMSGHNSKYFSTTKKGEIPELKEELNSQHKAKLGCIRYCQVSKSLERLNVEYNFMDWMASL